MTSFAAMAPFHGSSGGEGVTASALPLIFDRGDAPLGPPVDLWYGGYFLHELWCSLLYRERSKVKSSVLLKAQVRK
jgi:hypothetical protein